MKKLSCFIIFILTFTLFTTVFAAGNKFYFYPDSTYADGPVNPHIPFIAPEGGGASGKHLEVEKKMRFILTSLVDVKNKGKLTFFARDNKRRLEKDLVILSDGKRGLYFSISPASQGRVTKLGYKDISGKWPRLISSVKLKQPLTKKWTKVVMSWSGNVVTVKIGDEKASLQLPEKMPAMYLVEYSWHIDDLKLVGNGELSLDWDFGYAAEVVPERECKVVAARLFGFDTMLTSKNPAMREYPRVQIQNATNEDKVISLQFTLKSELGKANPQWEQKVTVNKCTSVMKKITFPLDLKTDIYHLYVKGEGFTSAFKAEKHFMFVERRREPAGPNKFALHHFHARALGDWPAPLAIGKVARYNCWGYIVGPAWIKDWDGKNGLNPDTPPEEWNWEVETDVSIKAGIETAVCLISQPLLDWQREKVYAKRWMGKLAWGFRGGKPNVKQYRKFVREFAKRYKGKVKEYEVENEPNGGHGGIMPEDYPSVVRAVYEEVHAVDPEAKVYGISGTSKFIEYMDKVFKGGGAKYMDGVAWHTYTNPKLPDDVDLYSFLRQANDVIEKTGKTMLLRNTETGIYTARRLNVEEAIPAKKVQEYIDAGKEPFVTTSDWWRYCLSERDAARCLVTNVTYNFLAGVKEYTFFGWATTPALAKNMEHAAYIFSTTIDGKNTQTPNLHSLAAGVMTSQYEGMLPNTGKLVDTLGVRGGIFQKKNKGELAVLWVKAGTRTVFVESRDPNIEVISVFGKKLPLPKLFKNKPYYELKLTTLPVYLHSKISGLKFIAPVSEIKSTQLADLISKKELPRKQFKVSFTLTNYYGKAWADTINFKAYNGSKIKISELPISLKPGKSKIIENIITLPAKSKKSRFIWKMSCNTPVGKKIKFYKAITIKPTIFAPKLDNNITFKEMLKTDMTTDSINRNEQCYVGRPPKLASLQEDKYWSGPDELSAKIKLGYNKNGILCLLKVKDKNAKLADLTWVNGSCVELFLDFRKLTKGLGSPAYTKNVYQYLLKPAIKAGQKLEVKNCSALISPDLKGAVFEGEALNGHGYWVGIKIPWAAIGLTGMPEILKFGFDVAIDGAFSDKVKRKTQMVLFGNGSNFQVADKFGQCIIDNSGK